MDHAIHKPIQVVFDLETRDPDDALTLCLLATHPAIDLRAVTITPGTDAQVSVVKEILRRLELKLPLGVRNPGSTADAVSPFHFNWLGDLPGAKTDGIAHDIIAQTLKVYPDTSLLTGAPLQNLRIFLRCHPNALLTRLVAQGGFAGDNLVEPKHRLPKFEGRITCESYNFGHDPKGALAAVRSSRILNRRLVGKNVTHSVVWDATMQRSLSRQTSLSPGLELAVEAMNVYLRAHPEGKLLHDPLAAAALIDPGAFTWVEADILYRNGQWGSSPRQGTGTFVAVAVNRARALAALLVPGDPTPLEWHP